MLKRYCKLRFLGRLLTLSPYPITKLFYGFKQIYFHFTNLLSIVRLGQSILTCAFLAKPAYWTM